MTSPRTRAPMGSTMRHAVPVYRDQKPGDYGPRRLQVVNACLCPDGARRRAEITGPAFGSLERWPASVWPYAEERVNGRKVRIKVCGVVEARKVETPSGFLIDWVFVPDMRSVGTSRAGWDDLLI